MAQDVSLYPAGSDGHLHGLFFHGTGGSLFGIYIVNRLLTVITLGIYYFWGKTKERSYLWSQTDFAGDRFAYHGTGKELLVGFLKATVVFGVPLVGLIFLPEFLGAEELVKSVGKFLFYIMAMMVIPIAMVGARRYRYSRTSWRGIFFSFRGSVKEFIKIFISGSILTMVTVGLYYPFFETKKHGFMVSHSYFGNQKFEFDGRGRDLFRSYLLTLLLIPFTLGMYWFWFQAKMQRYFWANTTVGGARFCSTVTGGPLLLLTMGNFLLMVFTLGLGLPWVAVRNARFACRYLTLEGPLNLTAIEQEAQIATATGEGLASFLDMDSGFDFG
ncbi:MAG: YjgN family protein [Candidatus Methylomirabilales bacterium]